jgi:hypothetical protein
VRAGTEEGGTSLLVEAVIQLDAAERAGRAAQEKAIYKATLRVARVLSKLPTLTEQGWVLANLNSAFNRATAELSEQESPKVEEVAA